MWNLDIKIIKMIKKIMKKIKILIFKKILDKLDLKVFINNLLKFIIWYKTNWISKRIDLFLEKLLYYF